MPRFRLLFIFIFALFPRHSAARSLDDGGATGVPDAAVELNSTTFVPVLKDSPATYAIVEFYAHWCPACRNYKHQYEKVARIFNGPEAVHPGIILMTRVDCASKVNTNLCEKFSVGHYPTLLWGPPLAFTTGSWSPKQKKSNIKSIDDGRTAERLLNWINKNIGSSFSLDDERFENENTLPRNVSNPDEIARAIYDIEEATTKAFEIIFQSKLIKSGSQAALVKFLQLLVAHHPSKRCRVGSAEILVNFDDMWPSEYISGISKDSRMLEEGYTPNSLICGKEVPRGYWIFCRGSKSDTRGFSCGLWVLFHSLSVRVGDGESNLTFIAICDFIQNFFVCDECRSHFHEMSSRVTVPFTKTRDLVLWLWKAHNQVNERLMKEEKELRTGDPRFPKLIWPPEQLCPSCYRSSSNQAQVEWDEDEVFKFLIGYYGRTLAFSSKDAIVTNQKNEQSLSEEISSGNALAVPLGAALAIALASCAFGALACFWRTQQKNRKYLHHLHSLKNISILGGQRKGWNRNGARENQQ